MKAKKEKPRYSVWQNCAYVIDGAWRRGRGVLWTVAAQIVLTVAVSVAAMYLSKTVVAQILSGVSMQTLVCTILVFTAVTAAMQAAKNYLDSSAQPPRTYLRIKVNGDILQKILHTDYSNLEQKRFTDLKQKANEVAVNNDTATEQIYYCFAQLGSNLLGFAVYLVLLAAVNPLVMLIAAVSAVAGVVARYYADKWRHDHDAEQAAFRKRIWYLNGIGNKYEMAKDIRLFAMTGWIKDLYNANLKLVFDFNRRVQLRQLAADIADCAVTFLREGAAYGYLIWLVLYGGLPVDQFVLLFAAIGGFSGWITGILTEYSTLTRHSLDYCRLREFLEYPNAFITDGGDTLSAEAGKPYTLELRDVSFRYDGALENTLEHINLTVAAGEKLAVVGLNGAGKTTLVKLLCGLYDPTEGAVLLNGVDIRRYDRRQYYQLFTAVFQEFNILPLTVSENIAQQPAAEADMERIRQCLVMADLEQKINSLPDGLSALLVKSVHENAAELSGGETQKLMLARALYKDSPVLILDEPTAALDPIAESRLYERYNALSAGKTSVYISHRLASTRFCDRIILVENKAIVESGTHDQLVRRGGRYAELFEIQSKYYKEHPEGEAV